MAFKVLQVDHIGIGVNDLAATKEFYKNALGIQHLPENAIADLMAKGVRMIDEKPRYGAGGSSIAFLHPKATGGVLLELCQRMK